MQTPRCPAPRPTDPSPTHEPRARSGFALALLVALAALPACDIRISGGDDCTSLDEVCPNLECEAGFVQNEDGCPICECADVDPGPTVCWDDGECSGGRVCDTVNFCEPPPGCQDGEACPDVCYGLCVLPRASCFSDADCAPEEFCNFATSGGGSTEPAPPPPEDGDAARPAPQGVCTPRDCAVDLVMPACPPGTEPAFDFTRDPCGEAKCVPVDGCRALPPDVCDATPGCHTEAVPCPCDPNGVCRDCAELVCVPDQSGCEGLGPDACFADPSCEGFFVGGGACVDQCDDAGNCSFCNGDGTCTRCSADGACETFPCESAPDDFLCLPRRDDGTCFSDAECGADERCDATWTCGGTCTTGADGSTTCFEECWQEGGLCVPADRTCWELTSDECLADPRCELVESQSGGEAPCACDPATNTCDCGGAPPPEPALFCQPKQPTSCTDDGQCAAGQHCEVTTTCPECLPGEACTAPCWVEGSCVDGPPPPPSCADGATCPAGTACQEVQVCTACPADDPAQCTGSCALEQRCLPTDAPATCFTDADCGADQLCDFSQGCPVGGTGALVAACGVCVDVREVCYSSADCAEGTACSVETRGDCQPDPSCPACDVCTGVCEAVEPPPPDGTYCQASSDCGSQTAQCRFLSEFEAGACLSNPSSDLAVCWGYCVEACGEAETPAQDPTSGACIVFPDTCVPPGWEVVAACP